LYEVHCSSKEAVEEIRKAKEEGVQMYGETCPHYLTCTKDEDPPGETAFIHLPIRGEEHRDALWEGLRTGVINAIGSDHVASPEEWSKVIEKEWHWPTMPGINNSVETILCSMLSEGVNKGRISLKRLVEVCCKNPALICGLYPKKGALLPGSDADIVIFDLKKKVENLSQREHLHGNATATYMRGRDITGWPIMTILRGNVVMENGEITAKPGFGQVIKIAPNQPVPYMGPWI
jgi:dihydropyrimidinase/dihydroorotase